MVHTLVQAHKPEPFVLLTYSTASPSWDQVLKGLVGKKFILMQKLSFEVINLNFCFPKWLNAFFKVVLQTIHWLYNVKKINQLNKRTINNKIISQNQHKFSIPKTIRGIGAKISEIDLVDKLFLCWVKDCFEYYGPIITNTCPSQKSLHTKVVLILPTVSEVENSYLQEIQWLMFDLIMNSRPRFFQ